VTRRAIAACAVVALLVAACAGSGSDPGVPVAFDDARQLWRQSGITSYRFNIEWFCFCPPTRGNVEVIDGEIASIVRLGGAANTSMLEVTIEDLFDRIESAAGGFGTDSGPGNVTAAFDSEYGFPVTVSADPILEAVDDEFGWEITGFVALDGAGFEAPDAPAGIHECALLQRREVDSVLGDGTPLGDFSTPAITISVCTWSGARSSLVLTLFPTPEGGLTVPYPDAVALPGSEEVFIQESDRRVLVVIDAEGTAVALQAEVEDPQELAELLLLAAGRLP